MTPEEMVSRLLYRDGLMLVIDKPAGMAVHRGHPNSKDRNRECLEDHFDALRFGLPRPPALAHRLDRDTSGCLVLGRHRKALAQLGKLFKNGAIDKTYWAVVEGAPDADEGEIELPLGRLDDTRGWWMKHDPDGPAGGDQVEGDGAQFGSIDLACARAADRAHASAPGALRGNGLADSGRRASTATRRVTGGPLLHLHAREIVVPLYKNRAPIRVVAPVPQHMRERLTLCGWRGEEIILPREAVAEVQ